MTTNRVIPVMLCSFPECIRKHEARGYCASHYAQLRRSQKLRPLKPPGMPNDYAVHDDYAEAILTDSCGKEIARSKIDLDDLPKISGYRWRRSSAGYVQGAPIGGGRQTMLHRLLLDAPLGVEVDHWDGDPLNNRRSNIRLVSRKQNRENQRINTRNKSGYRGVCWSKAAGKWQAYIGHNGKSTNLGLFNDVKEAAEAARTARERLFSNHRTRR